MEKATISQLKDGLSAYLEKVRAGRCILIMDRDEPIARLERIADGGAEDDRVTRLERSGLVRRGTGKLDLAALKKDAPRPSASVLSALADYRREGR